MLTFNFFFGEPFWVCLGRVCPSLLVFEVKTAFIWRYLTTFIVNCKCWFNKSSKLLSSWLQFVILKEIAFAN